MIPEPVIESWTPSSEAEKAAVQQQLERLLASPLFHSSKRYAQFLRFVVGRTLEGQGHDLKERILGIEVFDRPPDYDTNTDPIVRVTAAEIRKRIKTPGNLFAIYLILNGIERFFIEKIRVNSKYDIFGFHPTQAELISAGLVIAGAGILLALNRRKSPPSDPNRDKTTVYPVV